jgi:hypothetical protein
VSTNWRRITFIVTTGDRFEAAEEINDLFENESPVGRLYVTLKEAGIHAERDLTLKEKGANYQADLAISLGDDQWLPIMFTQPEASSLDSHALYLSPDHQTTDCLKAIQQELARSSPE